MNDVNQPDVWSLYRLMFRSRVFEEAVARLWHAGQISGEMHLNMGEEAIMAGLVSQLIDGDALALDHRGTAPLLMRGVDPVVLLREFLGRPDGLCGGQGGHMHLFSRDHLAASSGIVGSAGPIAAGFALAAQYLRPGTVALGFFGDGAINQGMLLESLNLAAAWKLPVLFVCKDNQWAITTPSESVSGGNLLQRAQGFGLHAVEVDGLDVLAVWQAAHDVLQHLRQGHGPAFLLAHCVHLEGHFLGDPLLAMLRQPVTSARQQVWPMARSMFKREGGAWHERLAAMRGVTQTILAAQQQRQAHNDPLVRACQQLADHIKLAQLEAEIRQDIQQVVERATRAAGKEQAACAA
jgi:acetoin:2,6-dichlorophenolindophenol oxidoreductase subunit alpha